MGQTAQPVYRISWAIYDMFIIVISMWWLALINFSHMYAFLNYHLHIFYNVSHRFCMFPVFYDFSLLAFRHGTLLRRSLMSLNVLMGYDLHFMDIGKSIRYNLIRIYRYTKYQKLRAQICHVYGNYNMSSILCVCVIVNINKHLKSLQTYKPIHTCNSKSLILS